MRKVHISGLNPEITEHILEAYFSKFGKVEDVLINCNRKTGKQKGFGFIRFESEQVAQNLINSSTIHSIGQSNISCNPCSTKKSHSSLIKKTLNIDTEEVIKSKKISNANSDLLQNSSALHKNEPLKKQSFLDNKYTFQASVKRDLEVIQEGIYINPKNSCDLLERKKHMITAFFKRNYVCQLNKNQQENCQIRGLALAISLSASCSENHHSDNIQIQLSSRQRYSKSNGDFVQSFNR